MNADWWLAIAFTAATFVFIVLPGVGYAYYVLELWIGETSSYENVMGDVER